MLNTQLPALKSSLLPTIETILRVEFFMNTLCEKRLFNNNSPNHSQSSLGNTQGKVSNRISNYIADEVRVIRTKFSFCFINQFSNFFFNFVQTFGKFCCFIRETPQRTHGRFQESCVQLTANVRFMLTIRVSN